MNTQNICSKVTASAGADARLYGPGGVRNWRESPTQGRHRGVTQLVRHIQGAKEFRVATLNVGTLTGRSAELTDALARRRIDICAVQGTRWFGSKARDIGGGYKILYHETRGTASGVGVIVAERFRDTVFDVRRYYDRLVEVVLATEHKRIHFFSVYVPQTGAVHK